MAADNSGAQLQAFLEKMQATPAFQRGNAPAYSPDQVTFNPQSPLVGKKIAFLGSSVTYGFAAKGKSFVDFLAARDGVRVTKSAISGTTLAGRDPAGYLARLQSDFSSGDHYDLFVCQLSTNDNRHGKKLGTRTPADQRTNFDCNTTLGAIEEICREIPTKLGCPFAFYTCLQDDPAHRYAELIKELYQLQAKWGFGVVDLFHNQGLLASTAAHPNAMFDDVHPTQEGYLKIWLPVFEQELTNILAN